MPNNKLYSPNATLYLACSFKYLVENLACSLVPAKWSIPSRILMHVKIGHSLLCYETNTAKLFWIIGQLFLTLLSTASFLTTSFWGHGLASVAFPVAFVWLLKSVKYWNNLSHSKLFSVIWNRLTDRNLRYNCIHIRQFLRTEWAAAPNGLSR